MRSLTVLSLGLAALVAAAGVASAAVDASYIFRFRGPSFGVPADGDGPHQPGGPTVPGTGGSGGGSDPATPPDPGGDRFLPASNQSIVANEGSRVSVPIGRYEGPAKQWSCSEVVGAAWLGCRFEGGTVLVEGSAPGAVRGSFSTSVVRAGYVAPTGGTIEIRPVARTAKALAAKDRYVPSGATYTFPVGTFAGVPAGWSCDGGSGHPLPAWANCAFEDGVVTLSVVGQNGTGNTSIGIRFLDGGVAVANTDYFQVYHSGNGDRGPNGSPPTSETATLAATEFYVPRGGGQASLGSYTGDAAGLTCFGNYSALPSWASCEFKDGRIVLVGKPSRHEATYLRIGVAKQGTVLAITNYVNLYADAPEASGAVADAARPGTATLAPTEFYVPSSGGRASLGAYDGGDGGWSCFGVYAPMPAWASCEFKDGNVVLVGTPGGMSSTYLRIGVARDGQVRALTNYVNVYTDRPTYATATSDGGRASAAALFDGGLLVPVDGGRASLGTYSGGTGGWTCFGVHSALPAWASCEFKDGNVVLVGAPASASNTYLRIGTARDGRVIALSNYQYLYTDATRYDGAVQDAARAGTATLTSRDITLGAAAGRETIGSYAGGEGGWACFSDYSRLPDGVGCEFADGVVSLVSKGAAATSATIRIGVARDGRQRALTNYVTLRTVQ